MNRILSVFTGHMNCIRKKSKFSCTAYALHSICFSFQCNSYGPWTLTKCDSIVLYLHLLTTKFVTVLLTFKLAQKCPHLIKPWTPRQGWKSSSLEEFLLFHHFDVMLTFHFYHRKTLKIEFSSFLVEIHFHICQD